MSEEVERSIAEHLSAMRRALLITAEALKSRGLEWPEESIGRKRFGDAESYVRMSAQSLDSVKACIGADRKR